jgi:cyclopropane fatty-acyl-phospholipid synthase-like methyltransferase
VTDNIKTMKLYNQVDRVFNELHALGIEADDPVEVGTLSAFDQYHYLGTDAVDEAIDRLQIRPSMQVLEVGGGIGGPSRYLAHVSGCHMTALELQPDLNATAARLTERCRLQDRVTHLCGDILDGPPGNRRFDALVSWLTFLHIPQRPALYRHCYNSLMPGAGIYVEDYFERGSLSEHERTALSREVYCDHVPGMEDYRQELEGAGFEDIELLDMSEEWTRFVVERQHAFESARDRNESLHGTELVEGLSGFYSTIVKLFQAGNLGGICFVARKPG